jgi:hypothetical protein
VTLTLTKHPDAQVDTLVVYARDVTAGETVRRIGTVANPAGATTTYAVTTNTWGSGTEAPTDHTVPQVMSFAVIWKNRWWGRDAVVKNRMRFTQIFEAQSWPADFTIDIPFERGDDIAAILPLGDTLARLRASRRSFSSSGRPRSTSKCGRVARVRPGRSGRARSMRSKRARSMPRRTGFISSTGRPIACCRMTSTASRRRQSAGGSTSRGHGGDLRGRRSSTTKPRKKSRSG